MITFDFSRITIVQPEAGVVAGVPKAAWQDLLHDTAHVRSIQNSAVKFRSRFENLVVIGIGGSSQGLKALASALLVDQVPSRLFVLESPDPRSVRHLMNTIDIARTCFNFISKSGTTIETLTLFDYFHPKLKPEQIVVTTEKNNARLHHLAQREGLTHLEIPKNVVGRFSVFSAVALFPLAFAGVDIETILEGARQADKNSARKNASIHYLLNKDHGKSIAVMMPYADCLYDFGRWYAQLWAESLGKNGKGQTPLVALGPQNQHSLAQLFLDGPKDKVVTFIKIASDAKDPLGKLLEAEWRATAEAFYEKEIPSITITLPALDTFHLGQLLMSYQLQTACVGHLMGIDPYSQPAVDLIKKRLQ